MYVIFFGEFDLDYRAATFCHPSLYRSAWDGDQWDDDDVARVLRELAMKEQVVKEVSQGSTVLSK